MKLPSSRTKRERHDETAGFQVVHDEHALRDRDAVALRRGEMGEDGAFRHSAPPERIHAAHARRHLSRLAQSSRRASEVRRRELAQRFGRGVAQARMRLEESGAAHGHEFVGHEAVRKPSSDDGACDRRIAAVDFFGGEVDALQRGSGKTTTWMFGMLRMKRGEPRDQPLGGGVV